MNAIAVEELAIWEVAITMVEKKFGDFFFFLRNSEGKF